MQKAYDCYRTNNYAESIYYESQALCLTFHRDKLEKVQPAIIDTKDGKVIESNPLLDYVQEQLAKFEVEHLLKKLSLTEVKDIIQPEIRNNINSYNDLMKHCSALPKEWTVLQICKMNNEYLGYGNFERYFTHDRPIKFTSFCYARSDLLNDVPLQFHLKFDNGVNILEYVHKLYFVLYKASSDDMSTNPSTMQEISTESARLIELMKQWIGPWVVFLSGNVKGANGKQLENQIFGKVDEFVYGHSLNSEQQVFLSQFARRIDLIDADGIETVAQVISDCQTVQEAIRKFLSSLKLKTNFKDVQYYPCILVLDELLDTMPWEMLIPQQEATRFNSIYMLLDLYKEYKNDIIDGYLRISVQNGNVLINPNDDVKLVNMVKRMGSFFSYWLPNWRRVEQSVPKDGLIPLLTSGDVYVYSGHGSSFQYLNYKDYATFKTKSVLLLFGCESANMTFSGSASEATATYMHIHACKCPTLLGTLSVVTDLWTDIVSIVLLSRWIPSEKKAFWKPVHIGSNAQARGRVQKLAKNINGFEPSLLAILASIRCESQFSIRMRAAMVCRGLPVYNKMAEAK